MCEICSKSSTKTTDFTHYSGVSIADFEQVNAGWVEAKFRNEHSFSDGNKIQMTSSNSR